jgi:hypothetical protein
LTGGDEGGAEALDADAAAAAIALVFANLPNLRGPPPPGAKVLRWDTLMYDIGQRLVQIARRGPRPRLSPAEERRLRELPMAKLSAEDRELLSRRPAPLLDRQALAALAQALDHALEALDDLSPRALAAIHSIRPDAALNLHLLRAAAKSAEEEAEKVKNRRGRPQSDPIAQAIAEFVAKHYHALTGEAPAGKAFVTLLQTVYDILGLKVSATSQAKKLAASWPKLRGLVA